LLSHVLRYLWANNNKRNIRLLDLCVFGCRYRYLFL
jgi:hypothetical protein